MLPNLHYQRYQKFSKLWSSCNKLRWCAARYTQAAAEFPGDAAIFQQQIVSLDAGDLEPDSQPRVRSYQTEMSKQLRLLGMDMMFCKRRCRRTTRHLQLAIAFKP